MKREDFNPHLQRAFVEVVENQLRDNDPPEAGETLRRLRGLGFSETDAKLLIGSAVIFEVHHILKLNEQFNEARYKEHLAMLPDQSFLEEEQE